MHSYEDTHGRLPPAAVCGEDGKPLLSWRVLLLPFLSQKDLYGQFKLDEPWDSPHNLRLLERMPSVYAPPPGKAGMVPPYHTVCHVFVGKGAAFEWGRGLRLKHDFPDGLSNTFLVVEAGKPVPWTKPEELEYDPYGPLPDLGGIFHDGFRARLADGSGVWIKKGLSEASLRAAITRNAGDKVGPDWDQ
jgi:hypothetical protein